VGVQQAAELVGEPDALACWRREPFGRVTDLLVLGAHPVTHRKQLIVASERGQQDLLLDLEVLAAWSSKNSVKRSTASPRSSIVARETRSAASRATWWSRESGASAAERFIRRLLAFHGAIVGPYPTDAAQEWEK
jgi:hypothetical protein